MIKLYLDIEVRAERFIPAEESSEPVACVSVLTTTNPTQVRTYLLARDLTSLRRLRIRVRDTIFEVVVLPLRTETSLLQSVAREIAAADCVLGWNIKGYDLPYLMNRMRKVGLDPSLMSPLGSARITREGEPVIEGVNILDLQTVYSEVNARTLFTSLERASQEVLGVGKLGSSKEVYRMSDMELVKYNAGDVILTYLLDTELSLSDFCIELARETHRPVAERYMKSQMVDSTLLAFARRAGVVLPTRRAYRRSRYEGAIVIDPVTGLHEDVLVADFKRMYPSIIINFNLSPETVVDPDEPVDKIVFNVDGQRIAIRQDVKGLVPAYLEELFKLRERYEQILSQLDPHDKLYAVYRQKRQIVKDTINSVYGQFAYAGNPDKNARGSRIFNIHLARLTTYLERQIITATRRIAESMGFEVLYGDTDSIFIKCHGLSDYPALCDMLTDMLNEWLEEQYGKRTSLVLEPKEHFLRVLLYKKKRYAGLVDWQDGEVVDPPVLEVKGFELVRTDTPKLTRDMQRQLFELLLRHGYRPELVAEFVQRYWRLYQSCRLEEIAVPTVVHRLRYKVKNVQAKAIEAARRLGIDVYVGKRLFWLYLKGGEVVAVDEENLDLLERYRDRVDLRRMFERNVLQKVNMILEVFKSTSYRQSTLL